MGGAPRKRDAVVFAKPAKPTRSAMERGEEVEPPKYGDPDSIIEFSEHKQLLCNDTRLVEQEMTSIMSLPPSA